MGLPYYCDIKLSHLNFCQWERSFYWKLRCHWLEFLRQRQIAAERRGPLQTPASPGAVLQRARRLYVWSPVQQMDSRANKCDVIIGNDMTSQSRRDLRQCVLSHWRFIQLSLRIVIISHWMLLHNSWTLYVSTKYLPPCVCGLFPSKWKNSTFASSFRKRHGNVLLDLLFLWDHDSVFLWNKWLIPL